MNFGSGFVKSKENPLVTGFEYDSFNVRNIGDGATGAGVTWQYSFGANVPGMGAIYTPSGINRSGPNFSFLQTKSLPTGDCVSQIFLSPQAEVPISGNTWYEQPVTWNNSQTSHRGLTVKYNCSIITNLSDFTILSSRNGTKVVASGSNTFSYLNANNDTIYIYNQTNSALSSARTENLEGVIEFGLSPWPKYPVAYDPSYSTSCSYNAKPDVTSIYPALD
jgi:hypothetical protein